MHEASLVMAMGEEIARLAKEQGAKKVLRVVVSFGQWSGIEKEAFCFAFEAFKKDSPLFKEADLEIELIPAVYFCPLCQQEFSPEEAPLCPRCKLPGLPSKGGELEIKKVEFLVED
ncbi:MAG TPA: hydrogenase maturation nickel metallochaperone HypA [Thermodesulfatator atlanticus]|uniref:Hydrogenase maturation factor HypA n=1 Tax=Thermodesulfatator atlanticus TaxID=501497 RepID=A0A7V5P1D3_9BACT|nr:hydrogenase maturation nickel metallochaperone HypA [Thermodesulfatator atlanticus]